MTSFIAGCQLFGKNHFQNATHIDRLAKHSKSDLWMDSLMEMVPNAKLSVPKASVWEGAATGMPINIVDTSTTSFKDVFLYHENAELHYPGPFPLPSSPRVEGYPGNAWDRHLLTIDKKECQAYELIQFAPFILGGYQAMHGATYSLDHSDRPTYTDMRGRVSHRTNNAANTPMVSQYIMLDDVNAGSVNHVMAWCTRHLSRDFTWPAYASDGNRINDRERHAPMGAWLRLRADVDTSGFVGQGKAIVEAMKRHGMILTDTCGSDFGLMYENGYDRRNTDGWKAAEVEMLGTLTPEHFEFVDPSPMIVSEDSHQIK